MSLLLRVVALILFVIAAFLVLIKTTWEDAAMLAPLGLAFWVASTLVGDVHISTTR